MVEFKPIPIGTNFQDLRGQTFAGWEVIGFAGRELRGKSLQTIWWCKCVCDQATLKKLYAENLKRCEQVGKSGCGCSRLLKPIPFPGSKSTEYRIWCGMRQRCFNPNAGFFHLYGGRGILVCAGWKNNFGAFYRDMGPRPSKKYEIDRIDNDRGYECGKCQECATLFRTPNCRWATRKEQMWNRTVSVRLTLHGVTRCLSEWSELKGIHPATVKGRLDRGWPTEKALLTPARHYDEAWVVYRGKRTRLTVVSDETGVSLDVLRGRLRLGRTIEEAIGGPGTPYPNAADIGP